MAILVRARADIRRRWRSWLGLALLVAIAGGGVLTLAAGARRTNTAYPRFLRAQRAADVFLFLTDPGLPPVVQRLPQVAESVSSVALEPAVTDFAPVVLSDRRLGQELNRFKFVAGRSLRPDRADEVVVSFLVAKSRHLRVGSRLSIPFLVGQAAPPAVTFRVVGIEAAPGEFPPRSAIYNLPVYLSPAFLRTPVGALAVQRQSTAVQLSIRLHGGARDVPAFLASVERLSGAGIGQSSLGEQAVNTQRSLHLQAVALWLMAGFVGLATTLILLQLLLRQGVEDTDDHVTLRSLGMTPGQLYLSGLVGVAIIGVVGAAGAVGVAAVLSPLLPLGTARVAEPHPGFAFDGTALGLGAIGIVLLVGVLGAAALLRITVRARHLSREEPRTERPSSVGNLLTQSRLPVVVTTGIRLAVQPGRGRTAVPVRATLVAAAIGVGAMAAAVTFGASLTHMLATPPLYGANFDADIRPTGNNGDARTLVPVLRDRPDVTAAAVALTGIPLQSGRVSFGALAQSTVKGSLEPTVIAGRLPSGPDEILLGSRTLHDLHAHVGQTIQVSVTGLTGSRALLVVGRGVLAAVQDNEQLGSGGVITPEGLAAFVASAPPGFSPPPPGDLFVRIRPGPGQQGAIDALSTPLGGPGKVAVYRPLQPGDVANFGQVGNLPQILAGLLGLIAATTMAHLLVSAVRRRRRDFAVLKTLGFVPRQVAAAIACQATVVTLLAVVVGLPLGLAAGRWGWRIVAGQVGLVVRPIFPWAVVALLVPAALLIANLVAAGPALVAGRIPPATVLRSE